MARNTETKPFFPAKPRKAGEIQTTLRACRVAAEPLTRLCSFRLPILVAYHLKTICRLVEPEARLYEELRQKLVDELGTKRKSTPEERARGWDQDVTVVDKGPKLDEFEKQMKELGDKAVTIRAVPVSLAALGAIEISASDLFELEPFVSGEPTDGPCGAQK